MDGHPCPDCRWTMYLMTGRPILVLRCEDCKNWFHANITVKQRVPSIIGVGWDFEASFNHRYSKDDLNSILRCDCLAKQVYMAHGVRCNDCTRTRRSVGHSHAGEAEAPRHAIRVRADDTLHEFITRLTKHKYSKSNLPAYTLQRRCGAVAAYLDRYMREVMTPRQAARTIAYRRKRLELREALDARQKDTTGSASSTDAD